MQSAKTSFLHLWPSRVILILWGLFVLLDYLFHHSYYEKALLESKYWGLMVILVLVMGGAWFLLFRSPAETKRKIGLKINGLGLYGLLLFIMTLIFGYYSSANNLFTASPAEHIFYFAGHTAMLHLFVFLIFLMAYAFGSLVMKPLKPYIYGVSLKIISLAVGLSIIGLLTVILGCFNLLHFWILWPLLLSATVLQYKSILPFLKVLFIKRISMNLGWQGLLVALVLFIFIAINAIGAIKIFPTGFDGGNLYMNTSKLIGEYHGLPEGGQAFNWSVIMSFGILLFGNSAVSILLSHLAGILCLIAVFRIAKLFMSADKSLLAATLFYISPYISFHNFKDEKVDLGFLFISLSVLLLLLEFHFNRKKNKPDADLQLINWKGFKLPAHLFVWILAGWLTGYAFGIKYIALLNFIALMGYLCYLKAGRIAFAGAVLTALGGVFLIRVDRFAAIDLGTISPLVIAAIFLMIGLGVSAFSFKNAPSNFKKIFQPALLFTAFFMLAYTPWGIKHLSENKTLSVSSFIEGKSPRPILKINPAYYGHLQIPESTDLDLENSAKAQFISLPQGDDLKTKGFKKKQASAVFVDQKSKPALSAGEQTRREELHRYLGFEKGLPLYFSLPYDLTMNTNFSGHIYLDIGFLFLLLFPLLLLSSGKMGLLKNSILFLLMSFLLLMAFHSVYGSNGGFESSEAIKGVDKLLADSTSFAAVFGGIYKRLMLLFFGITGVFSGLIQVLSKTNFILMLFALIATLVLVYWLAKEKIESMPLSLKALFTFLSSFLFFWIFMGNGIPWYAFPGFSLLPVLLVYYFSKSEQIFGEAQKVFFNYFFGTAFALFMGFNLISHFHEHDNGKNAHIFFKTPSLRFAGKQMTSSDVLGQFNPFFPDVMTAINGDLDAKVYRVGTYLNYHILNNDRRVLEDNQLGQFGGIEADNKLTGRFFQILKENGFRYIVYDLRTATIDKTPEQSLKKKNQAFVRQLLNSGEAQLLVTDRIVKDPGGKTTSKGGMNFGGVPGLIGEAVYQGSFALFEIK